jgi:molecular chaperone DnaK (HSP70)
MATGIAAYMSGCHFVGNDMDRSVLRYGGMKVRETQKIDVNNTYSHA